MRLPIVIVTDIRPARVLHEGLGSTLPVGCEAGLHDTMRRLDTGVALRLQENSETGPAPLGHEVAQEGSQELVD